MATSTEYDWRSSTRCPTLHGFVWNIRACGTIHSSTIWYHTWVLLLLKVLATRSSEKGGVGQDGSFSLVTSSVLQLGLRSRKFQLSWSACQRGHYCLILVAQGDFVRLMSWSFHALRFVSDVHPSGVAPASRCISFCHLLDPLIWTKGTVLWLVLKGRSLLFFGMMLDELWQSTIESKHHQKPCFS